MYNIRKIQNFAASCVNHDYSHYISISFLQKQLNWLPFSVRRLQSTRTFSQNLPSENCHHYPTLFTNTPQNYTPHLKHTSKTATNTDNSAHQQPHTITATSPDQSQTGIHCHPVCVRHRCRPSRKA